jgi:2,3-bisphosphoglycerate-independent phosphoglycerate mutase
LRIAETEKYAHVTFFFNGGVEAPTVGEDRILVQSPRVATYDLQPEMSAREVTDKLVDAIRSEKYDAIVCNYANGDMVGHTGNCQAVKIAVETVDLCIGRLLEAIRAIDGILVVSADHGNSDDMYEHNKKGEVVMDPRTGQPKAKTSHSLNPVPCFIYDPSGAAKVRLSEAAQKGGLGISSLAATCVKLLGYEAPSDYDPAVVEVG